VPRILRIKDFFKNVGTGFKPVPTVIQIFIKTKVVRGQDEKEKPELLLAKRVFLTM